MSRLQLSALSAPASEEDQQQQAGSSQPARGLRRLLQKVRHWWRPRQPPLFRPGGWKLLRGGRKRWGHPVQLIECREFFYNEAIFLDWLRLAVNMASVAVLLLGYSTMAYVNPTKRPTLHVAELITLLLLPTSCLMVGYAIVVYIWRGRRLHSMRYKRVDDPVGPLLMTLAFVAAMHAAACLLVNVADLILMLQPRQPEGAARTKAVAACQGWCDWV